MLTITVFSSLLFLACSLGTVPPVVQIGQGKMRGKTFTTRGGRTVAGFLGIPYAAPPVGQLRFQKPAPPKSWEGTRDATQYGNPCLQNDYLFGNADGKVFGHEDCLYLNVFTPRVSYNGYYPVMVWIHGGSYFSGSAEMFIGPEYLLDKNVVLVSINYRLGVMGFLAKGDNVIPGNYGLKDQTAALRWVKNNIRNFGGDPGSVTIFGFSAGGGCVNLHMMSPLSKGLFHAGISQSGTGLSVWSTRTKPMYTQTANAVAAIFNCSQEDSNLLLQCLRQVPGDEFFRKVNELVVNHTLNDPVMFRPVVEPKGNDAFLPVHPSLVKTSVPWIVGLTSQEGAMSVALLSRQGLENILPFLNTNYAYFVSNAIMLQDKTNNISQIIDKTRQFYFGKREINEDAIPDLVNIFTDDITLYGHLKSLRQHVGVVYQYYFSYKGSDTWARVFGYTGNSDLGVCHMDELLYMSNISNYFPNRKVSRKDLEISENLITMWTNFAKYRNPTPKRTLDVWRPITSPDMEYYHIKNGGFRMEKRLLKERGDFWLSLPINDNPDGHTV